jgi:hypothetical protein
MIISLEAHKHTSLYEDVKNAFIDLEPMIPTTIHIEVENIQNNL